MRNSENVFHAYYLDLARYELLHRKPRKAIEASLKAVEWSPDNAVTIKTNLAHGYLFDNQFDKAKAIYLENKDAKLSDERSFSQAVLEDFKETLRRRPHSSRRGENQSFALYPSRRTMSISKKED